MRLLIIGNSNEQVIAASVIARKKNADVTHTTSIESALNNLRTGAGADLVFIDVKEDIKKFVDSVKEERINLTIVAYGINAKSEEAVKAIKAGAKEFIPLPPDEQLISAIFEAITEEANQVIFGSQAMAKALQIADQIAQSDASVLITGESGTGKEVMASYIHRKSRRKDRKFISINCAAIPENLLESELFGHEKGSFTGAVARRIGKFEEADGGTLLLDEISEMDVRLQAKLLRAIQERVIDRVGGKEPVKINIRILATSNRDMLQAVREGKFREDLYFRLNVISIPLPPLRDRKDDIPAFSDYFMKKYTKANGLEEKKFSDSAMQKLKAHNWPGNVREFENTIHRAVLMSPTGTIEPDAVMTSSESSASTEQRVPSTGLVGRTMESVERELILSTLDHCLGNRTHAANILGISIRTLRNKLKEYGEGQSEEKKSGIA